MSAKRKKRIARQCWRKEPALVKDPQLDGQLGQALPLSLREAVFHGEVLPLDVAEVLELGTRRSALIQPAEAVDPRRRLGVAGERRGKEGTDCQHP
jgi:hypothetical protein